ncbi:sugar ABC transporter substrate-binding protein [Frigoribacterium sp. VKM Ac-2836]|uniref:ABC transporter substrate-binding protein n=1 Tax=Frigoribacterium sp. VKM Ac-2836 TaxID=2739014 RepID=UPI0015636F80|nr:sugar ABC transporter substrate-binding protein [Frigoribacterium sp. VKM Ac-2836]NRD25130.1 sugar ABC transporter substrate-binding protein [Frigoribacterium sp. VKM Ac-2836]
MSRSSIPRRGVRRRLSIASAALGISLVAAGCSSAGGPAAADDYEAAPDDLSASITYGVWDQAQVAAIDANLEGFNELYPNIDVSVNVTPYADYFTKLQTQASSDSLPDLFWLNGPNFQLYASNGKVEPITGAVEAGDLDTEDYPEALVDLYSLDGVQYGVPKDMDTIGVWVNEALFEQAGVPLPEADWTWDDFQRTAATLSEALSAQGAYGGAGGMDGQTTYYDTIAQAGGEVVADDGAASGYDTDEAKAGLQFWADLISSGGSPSIQQLTDTPADQWFTSGKLAMYWGGSWLNAAVSDSPVSATTEVLPLPAGEEKATVIHGVSNVVAAGSENKQAAQALQVYLAGQEAQQQQGDLGAVIPAFTGTQQGFVDSAPDRDLQVFLDAVDYAVPLPVSKNSAAWNALEDAELPGAFSGDESVDDVATNLGEQMTALLAKE